LSPTLRSPTFAVSPLRLIVVSGVTLIVRVQPSSVFSSIVEPSIFVIVIPRWPTPRRRRTHRAHDRP
jgi:hypothetical protein